MKRSRNAAIILSSDSENENDQHSDYEPVEENVKKQKSEPPAKKVKKTSDKTKPPSRNMTVCNLVSG